MILFPLDTLIKKYIIQQAKRKLSNYPHVKVIAITGSYGKTTTKEFVKALISTKFRTIATPGTHNTPLGISRFIQQHLNEDTEIIIIEMGAYHKGDIQQLCDIIAPDIGIITGITYQHVERFGSLQHIIEAKFELARNIKPGGVFLFNANNKEIKRGRKLYQKELSEIIHVPTEPKEAQYLPELGGISFQFEKETFTTKLLAKYNAKNLSFGIAIAKHLGIDTKTLQQTIQTIDFIPHRMQLIKNPKGISIIDDSFNGNIEGVKSTIDLLHHTHIKGKKIYLTPGLVELGEMNEQIHLEIGSLLSEVVDMVLLISNSATKYIQIGLTKSGFDSKNIKVYSTTSQAHENLPKILQDGDLLVFQNDWTDNYQ